MTHRHLDASRFQAPALWEKLSRYSPEKRRGLVQDTDRFLSWGLCELLCQQSRETAAKDAVQAVELAELEAAALLPEVAKLTREAGSALDHVRLRWAEGRIAAGLGETARAVELFRSVRQDFLAQGIGYDAALVSLEMASLYAREGKTAEMKELAAEMLPVFRSRDVHREALAALAVFQQAVAREAAGVELVGRVASFLDRARHDPGLRFEAESGKGV